MAKRFMSKERGNVVILLILLLAAGLVAIQNWNESARFDDGTFISNIDCSRLTVEQALEKIENAKVEVRFSENKLYEETGTALGRTISDIGRKECKDFLSMQKSSESKDMRTFMLRATSYDVDVDIMKETLFSFDELNEKYMEESKDAYLQQTESGKLQIVPEVNGTKILLNEAVDFANEELLSGKNTIDFEVITDKPKVTKESFELISKMQVINNALRTEITYTLSDGNKYTLDEEIISGWVQEYQTEEYDIDFTEAVTDFVKELNDKVKSIGAFATVTVESGTYSLPVVRQYRNTVDVEQEIQVLLGELKNGVKNIRTPYYSRYNEFENLDTYIEVGLNEQRVRMYVDGEKILDAPCITGTKGKDDTPIGISFSNMKSSPFKMTKYSVVTADTWVTVDGNVGIHDASEWRNDSEYTQDRYLYDGSHGCINMRKKDAKVVFENVLLDVTANQKPTGFMPIIVHD